MAEQMILTIDSERDLFEGRVAELNADSPTIGLFVNDVTPNPDTVLGNLTPATFDGYEGLPFSLGPVFRDQAGEFTSLYNAQFQSTPGPGTTNICHGAFIAKDGALLAALRFENPVPMGEADQALPLQIACKEGVLTFQKEPN